MMKESFMTVPPDPRIVRTSNCEIAYREVGDGPALVAFHGGGPGASGWGNFGANVADFSARHRVIVPDLPGWGGSRVIVEDGTWPEVVIDALAEFLQEIDVSSRAPARQLGGRWCRAPDRHPLPRSGGQAGADGAVAR